jgi:hypothetical protein
MRQQDADRGLAQPDAVAGQLPTRRPYARSGAGPVADLASHDSRVRLAKLWDWAGKSNVSEEVHRCDGEIVKLTEEELRRFVLDCALISEIRANSYDTRKPLKLLETAKRLRIETDELRKTLKAEQAAKQQTRGKGATKTPSQVDRSKSSNPRAA